MVSWGQLSPSLLQLSQGLRNLGVLPPVLSPPIFGLGQESSLSDAPTMQGPGPPTLAGLATMDIMPTFPGEER